MNRLEQAADRQELRSLVDRYARAADERNRRNFAGVFTPDGVLSTSQGGRFEGRSAIAALIDHLDAHYPRTMHFVGNHDVELDGDHAEALVYCLAHHMYSEDAESRRDTLMLIRYRDKYIRTEEGWRIKSRDLDIHWEEDRPLKS